MLLSFCIFFTCGVTKELQEARWDVGWCITISHEKGSLCEKYCKQGAMCGTGGAISCMAYKHQKTTLGLALLSHGTGIRSPAGTNLMEHKVCRVLTDSSVFSVIQERTTAPSSQTWDPGSTISSSQRGASAPNILNDRYIVTLVADVVKCEKYGSADGRYGF